MKYRNIQVAKMTGTKILAGLLAFGLTFSAPATAWAARAVLQRLLLMDQKMEKNYRQNPLMGEIHLQKYQILSWR